MISATILQCHVILSVTAFLRKTRRFEWREILEKILFPRMTPFYWFTLKHE